MVVRSDQALSLLDDTIYSDMTQEDIREMTPDGFDLIEGKAAYIDNKHAAYFLMSGEYKTANYTIPMKQIMIQTIVKGKMYSFGCTTLETSFDKYEATIKRIVNTLVFEYYNEEYTIADSWIEENYTYFWLSIILSLVLTWGIGLTPPLLIRYVFLKKPMGKKGALAVCGLFFFLNIIVFSILGSESKTHTALILVAFISYWILKKNRGELYEEDEKTNLMRLYGITGEDDGKYIYNKKSYNDYDEALAVARHDAGNSVKTEQETKNQ